MSREQDRRPERPDPRYGNQDPGGGYVRHPQAVQQGRDLCDRQGVPGRGPDHTGVKRLAIQKSSIDTLSYRILVTTAAAREPDTTVPLMTKRRVL